MCLQTAHCKAWGAGDTCWGVQVFCSHRDFALVAVFRAGWNRHPTLNIGIIHPNVDKLSTLRCILPTFNHRQTAGTAQVCAICGGPFCFPDSPSLPQTIPACTAALPRAAKAARRARQLRQLEACVARILERLQAAAAREGPMAGGLAGMSAGAAAAAAARRLGPEAVRRLEEDVSAYVALCGMLRCGWSGRLHMQNVVWCVRERVRERMCVCICERQSACACKRESDSVCVHAFVCVCE
jgi:glycine/D-amino acid oxidase-like deaminating enzyme